MPKSSAELGWRLRRATPADAPAGALVAAASFLEAFAGVLDGADIVAHLAANSSAEQFAGWAADPACVVTLAEHDRGRAPIGYTVLTPPDLPVEPGAADVELKRIYTLQLAHGRGLGHALMNRALDDARAMGKTRVILGVYGQNRRAHAFYEREAFVRIGTRRFRVGDAIHDDLVYGRSL